MNGPLSRLFLVVLLLAAPLLARAAADCRHSGELASATAVLEDPTAALTLEQVAARGADGFVPMTALGPVDRYSRSAYWLRVELANPGAELCRLWLSIGAPRLERLEVFWHEAGGWQWQVAGSRQPLEDWPGADRQPLFPQVLAPGEARTLLVRVESASTLLLSPQRWTYPALLAERQLTYLGDGVTLGIVALVVPFSLVVGRILRSPLLLVHAGAVFFYLLVTAVVNGYLLYWPALLPWSREIGAGLAALAFLFVLAYLRLLLQVRALPVAWRRAFDVAMLARIVCLAWVFSDPWLARLLSDRVTQGGLYGLVPLALLVGWRRGIRLGWLPWTVVGLFLVQFLVRYVLQLEQLPWQSLDTSHSLSSTLPGVALLVGTLLLEVRRVRLREEDALGALERQRRAEQQRLEAEVTARTRELHESLLARRALLARIGHDLRTPLGSIIDYARLWRRGGAGADYSRNIERSARRQLDLIDELLEFSRGDLQRLELAVAPGYLYGFLDELVEECRFLAARRGNRLACELDELPPLVCADFRRLRQILMNLLGNAAKFTRDGDIRLRVERLDGAAPGQACLRFSVTDTGIGIDPGEQQHLLQPFRRGANAGRYEGSGLGLAIVAQLLGYMGSELHLERPEAGGSRFHFTLVLATAEEGELDAAFAQGPVEEVDGAGRRVLVVDDLELNCEWLADLLAGYGFDPTTAADGHEALALLEEERFDLLLTDQGMPGLDGWGLLEAVRQRWPGLPVLLYSAAPPRPPQGYPAGLGFDATLLKPSDAGALLACIDRLAPRETSRCA